MRASRTMYQLTRDLPAIGARVGDVAAVYDDGAIYVIREVDPADVPADALMAIDTPPRPPRSPPAQSGLTLIRADGSTRTRRGWRR